MPVDAVQRFIDRGIADADILEAYPALEPADIEKVRLLATA